MAVRARKSKSDYGSLYKGHPGQWSWVLHRITGVAVILFLFMHVVDTALVGWGPEAYDQVMRAYANPIVHLLELGLVIAVLYHSLNGLKITADRLLPPAGDRTSRRSRSATATVFLLAAHPDDRDHAQADARPLEGVTAMATTTTPVARARPPDPRDRRLGRERPVGGGELWLWLFMRISGLLLLVLALGHLVDHAPVRAPAPSGSTSGSSPTRWQSPFWRTWDWMLLMLALVHGINGLRNITLDYVQQPGAPLRDQHGHLRDRVRADGARHRDRRVVRPAKWPGPVG